MVGNYANHRSAWTLILVALFASIPAVGCENAASLKSPRHLYLGVRFSTPDPRIIEQTSRALNRWSEIADLAWHREDSDACSIEIEERASIGINEIAEANAERGSIIFAGTGELSATELFITAFHEIGHLLGLQHNPSPRSVMYWIDIRGDEVLDQSDMRALAATHALRGTCAEAEFCRIMPDASVARNAVSETHATGAGSVAWGRVSSRSTAKRARRHHQRSQPKVASSSSRAAS